MNAGLLLAAGRSSRYEGDRPKQFADLSGKPILNRALDAFDAASRIDQYLVLGPDQALTELASLGDTDNRPNCLGVEEGGSTRRESVRIGLSRLRELDPETVFVHDVARPVIPDSIFETLSTKLAQTGLKGAIPALRPVDTIKQVEETEPSAVEKTLDRDRLRRVQTPQLFEFKTLLEVHLNWPEGRHVTDDASMLEKEGYRIGIVEGSPLLRKITYESDRRILETLLEIDRQKWQT